jgi:hypothetical protein
MSRDPVAILDQFNVKQLRERLTAIERERSAIIVLLRATAARDRKHRRCKRREVSPAH